MQQANQLDAMDLSMVVARRDQVPNLVTSWHESPASLSTTDDSHALMSGVTVPLSPGYFFNGIHHHYHPLVAHVMPTNLAINTQLSNSSSGTMVHLDDDMIKDPDASEQEDKASSLSARNSISISSFDELMSPVDAIEGNGQDVAEGNAQFRLECIRERNRVAARKYRQKQKDHSSKLEKDGEKMQREREKLMSKVKRLQNENHALKQRCQDGLCWNCRQAT